jgi:hypothetical protein
VSIPSDFLAATGSILVIVPTKAAALTKATFLAVHVQAIGAGQMAKRRMTLHFRVDDAVLEA